MIPENKIICGDCLKVMREWPDNCVDLVVTSPPYWGLRDYGVAGQLGLEKTPEEYVEKIVIVFRELRRIIKPRATAWLVIGDSYVSGKGRYSSCPQTISGRGRNEPCDGNRPDIRNHSYLKDKDLAMVPAQIAISLQKDGWWLRNDIIWAKPNPMPESVTDRCTKTHEHILFLTKSSEYHFDSEAVKEISVDPESYTGRRFRSADRRRTGLVAQHFDSAISKKYERRNRRDVWVVNVKNNTGTEHYAQYPEELIMPCILAGCPKDGIVLDPFFGAGTSGVVAIQLGRRYIGIDISEKYCEIARQRLEAVDTGVPVREQKQGQQALFPVDK